MQHWIHVNTDATIESLGVPVYFTVDRKSRTHYVVQSRCVI